MYPSHCSHIVVNGNEKNIICWWPGNKLSFRSEVVFEIEMHLGGDLMMRNF